VAVYPVATILDPCFKLGYYHDHEWEQEWIQEAQTTFRYAFARYRASPVPDVQEGAPTKCDDSPESKAVNLKVRFLKRRRIVQHDEFEEYLAAPRAEPETDVLQWWKVNATAYPRLAAMARDYLAIPATSAPVERVFSGGTDLVQPKRGSLSEDTIRACMCLKSWLKVSQ
jgi:hAT family C-terminal dimerisation region